MTASRFQFKIVHITGFDARTWFKDLCTAADQARLGDFGRVAGDRESYGRALLGIDDFCRCPSGLLDDGDVRFPEDKLPIDEAELAERFRWMMHAPCNAEVIEALINALRPLWERNPYREKAGNPITYAAILPKPYPGAAASAVFRAKKDHPVFANHLMQGYLVEARRYIGEQPTAEQAELRETYAAATIFWHFFKAQIYAARLFHAEWNPFETGAPDAPYRITIGGAAVPIDAAREIARIATRMVGREDVSDSERAAFAAFVGEHDLERLARNEASMLGFSAAQIDGTDPAPEALLAHLHGQLVQFDELIADFVDSFVNSWKSKAPKVTDQIHYTKASGNRREKYGPKEPSLADQIEAIRAKGSREADMLPATARYGMPTLTCLTYAIYELYSAIVALAEPHLVKVWGHGDKKRSEALLQSAAQVKSDAFYNLLAVYRAAITRDRHSGVIAIDADHTGLNADLHLEDGDEYDGTDYVIENRKAVSEDGLDKIMGRGISLRERLGTTEFDLLPRGQGSGFRGQADKAVREASAIRKFQSDDDSEIGKAVGENVEKFRKDFGFDD